jgi:Skp family chaperone for outer membrane proteins
MYKLSDAKRLLRVLGIAALALGLSACEPTTPAVGGVAVIDLDAVAKAVGRDQVIAEQVESFARAEGVKLQDLKAELEQKVSGATAALGEDASDEAKQSVNTLAVEARNQLVRELGQARQSAQDMRTRLVREFAIEVQPIASRVAQERGFGLVMVKQPAMLAVTAEVDITGAVIDQLKASAATGAASVTPALPGANSN